MRVNTKSARPQEKPKQVGNWSMIVRFLSWLVRARIDGSYRITPFFDPERGTPVVKPRVLDPEERDAIFRTL
jgi:hypothetical protein